MRLFRQSFDGDWPGVVKAMKNELKQVSPGKHQQIYNQTNTTLNNHISNSMYELFD